jgi:uncharacterized Zn-binding protein involved in type VI secretion
MKQAIEISKTEWDSDTVSDKSVIIGKKGYKVQVSKSTEDITLTEDKEVKTGFDASQFKKNNQDTLAGFKKTTPAAIDQCIAQCTNDAIKNALSAVNTDPTKEAVIVLQKAVYDITDDTDKKLTGVLTSALINAAFQKSGKNIPQKPSNGVSVAPASFPEVTISGKAIAGLKDPIFKPKSDQNGKVSPHGEGELTAGTDSVSGKFENGNIVLTEIYILAKNGTPSYKGTFKTT